MCSQLIDFSYSIKESDEKARAQLIKVLPTIQHWSKKFLKPKPQSEVNALHKIVSVLREVSFSITPELRTMFPYRKFWL